MAIAPIWKDYIVSLGNDEEVLFRVKNLTSDEIIYNGKSRLKPGKAWNDIRINEICADYLHNTLPTLNQADSSSIEFSVEVFIVVTEGEEPEWTSVDNVTFYNDWSYDYGFNIATMGKAFPINGRVDARQLLMFSAYNATSVTATITFTDGTTSAETIEVSGDGTAVIDLADYTNVATITIGNKTYEVVTDCAQWVLYYANAHGGWDSFLIEGLASERDQLTRHSREMEYDNRYIRNRGKENFVNEVSKIYTLNTSWLSDEESARMHHLLNSTNVYLYNINFGEMIPVVLNGTTTEYKTYKSNGGKLVNYTIEATVAQERVRR